MGGQAITESSHFHYLLRRFPCSIRGKRGACDDPLSLEPNCNPNPPGARWTVLPTPRRRSWAALGRYAVSIQPCSIKDPIGGGYNQSSRLVDVGVAGCLSIKEHLRPGPRSELSTGSSRPITSPPWRKPSPSRAPTYSQTRPSRPHSVKPSAASILRH